MKTADHFPPEIRSLPEFEGPFYAHRLAATDCEVLFATYPAGTSIAPHRHSTNNVGLITRGQLELTIGGRATVYGPGDWYHVPPEVEHAASFVVETAEIEFWFERKDTARR